MLMKKLTAGVAMLGLAATPVLAQVAVPATAPVQSENALGEESGGTIALIAVVAIVVIGAILLSNGDDDPISA